MALRENIETPHGATCSYWRVVGIHVDGLGGAARIVLAGYVSEATRQAGKPHLDVRTFTVQGEAFLALAASSPAGETLYDAMATAAYEHVKQPDTRDEQGRQGEFAAAEDV